VVLFFHPDFLLFQVCYHSKAICGLLATSLQLTLDKESKMAEKKDTIQSLLTEDNRKHLAELLLNDAVSDMVVIYRKGDAFHCDVTNQAIANTVGMLEMAKILTMNDWLHPEEIDEHEFGGEDGPRQ